MSKKDFFLFWFSYFPPLFCPPPRPICCRAADGEEPEVGEASSEPACISSAPEPTQETIRALCLPPARSWTTGTTARSWTVLRHENARPVCCTHRRCTAQKTRGMSPTAGWVSLILSPESEITLQHCISTGFVTHSPNPGASPGAAGGGFYTPCPARDHVPEAISPLGPR